MILLRGRGGDVMSISDHLLVVVSIFCVIATSLLVGFVIIWAFVTAPFAMTVVFAAIGFVFLCLWKLTAKWDF